MTISYIHCLEFCFSEPDDLVYICSPIPHAETKELIFAMQLEYSRIASRFFLDHHDIARVLCAHFGAKRVKAAGFSTPPIEPFGIWSAYIPRADEIKNRFASVLAGAPSEELLLVYSEIPVSSN